MAYRSGTGRRIVAYEARTLVLDALREYLLSIRGNGDAVDRELIDLRVA